MTIHDDHPRRDSLLSRQKIVDAQNKGLLADSALIAHGRGEAFDYLLGECTTPSARRAEEESVNRLAAARRPVISLNGNSTVLAGRDAVSWLLWWVARRDQYILQNELKSQPSFSDIESD